MSNFSELTKILTLEQTKGYRNSGVIGGMEAYVEKWARRTENTSNAETIRQIVEALAGYGRAEPAERDAMIRQAVALARTADDRPGPSGRRESSAGGAPVPPPGVNRSSPSPGAAPIFGAAPPASGTAREPFQPLPPSLTVEPIPEEEEEVDPDELRSGGALPPMDFGLDAEVTRLHGVGAAKAAQLARLGIATVRDLLYYFPRAYRPVKKISELMYGDEATIVAQVSHINAYRTRNNFHITDVVLSDPTGGITAKFFMQPWLSKQLRPRQYLVVSGKVDRDLNKLCFKSPEHEPLTKELQRLLSAAHVYPIYPLTEGVKASWLRKTARGIVGFWADKVADPLPASLRTRVGLMPLSVALREIHFPTSMETMAAARHRFAFEELLYIQLGVLRQRSLWRQDPARPLTIPPDFIESFESGLPYSLTAAQKRAIEQLCQDIQQSAPMSRLLQGDVGAGKTVVALAALLVAVQNGFQAVLMAPTEILAEQHFKTIDKLLPGLVEKLGIQPRVQLLIGSMKPRDKQQVQRAIAAGEVDLAIGTHALIQEAVNFSSLSLAVIDEQHRFGVGQRAALRQKGYNPHILVMSATPIPRTLALTVYGDLDLSILDEMPPGRTPILTKWFEPQERERAYAFIRKQVAEGRQAFVICPLIQESETIDARAAVEEYERLRTQVYPDLRVGLIHGKLRSAEKDAVMTDLSDSKIDVLVATSVVEVGIDIPNATVMLIEGADRFGLAQLHQFRGRVGRGAHKSYCMLLAEKSGSTSDERLKVIEGTQDGFKLAEADLLMRGPGEFFGTRQSGLPDLKVAQLTDVKLLEQARAIALEIFERDPDLRTSEFQPLKKGMQDFWHGEGDLS